MSDLSLFQTKYLVLGSVLLLVALVGGCQTSKEATHGEDLSKPLDSVNRINEAIAREAANAQGLAQLNQVAALLRNRQGELEHRIGELTERLHLAETTLENNKADALKVALNQPASRPRTEVRRGPDRYEEVIGQYKVASERFKELLENGVPKDLQDQIHHAAGIAEKVDSLQGIVSHNAQMFQQDLNSKLIWIYLMTGIILILGMLTYGAFNQTQRQRKDLEKRVFSSLSSSFSFFEEKIKQMESEIASNAPPKQLATPKKSRTSIE